MELWVPDLVDVSNIYPVSKLQSGTSIQVICDTVLIMPQAKGQRSATAQTSSFFTRKMADPICPAHGGQI